MSDLIEGRLSSEAGRTELVRLATRLIIEEGLEAEVRDTLGRDYYERSAAPRLAAAIAMAGALSVWRWLRKAASRFDL